MEIKEALIIASIAVFIIDLPVHYFLSSPMETTSYFIAKFIFYSIFSLIFLNYYDIEDTKIVIIAGTIVASLWGIYYNILPSYLGYVPYGLALKDVTFLNFGYLGSALGFGITHTLGFVLGARLVGRLE